MQHHQALTGLAEQKSEHPADDRFAHSISSPKRYSPNPHRFLITALFRLKSKIVGHSDTGHKWRSYSFLVATFTELQATSK